MINSKGRNKEENNLKINKKLLMAALASAVIVSAPQAKTFADTQTDSSQAISEKTNDNQAGEITETNVEEIEQTEGKT